MLKGIFKNCGNPRGVFGKLLLYGMNKGHAPLHEWALSLASFPPSGKVLDIGCGGGSNLERLLHRCPRGFVCGIDISECGIEFSRRKNTIAINGGRCEVKYGSAAAIPYPDVFFDAATAFETVYFWKELGASFREVKRVLRPGGFFLVANDQSDPERDEWSEIVEGMKIRSPEELEIAFREAGFSDLCLIPGENGRLCVIGRA